VDLRSGVRVEPGGDTPLVLPALRQHLGRAGHEQPCGQDGLDRTFLAGIEIREQAVDSHRLGPKRTHRRRERHQILFGDGIEDAPIGADAPSYLQTQLPWHGRCAGAGAEIIEIAPGLAPDRQKIAEPAVGHEAGPRALALQDRVRGYRGPVDDAEARFRQPQRLDPCHDGALRRLGGREDLMNPKAVAIICHEVGEGPPGVHAEHQAAFPRPRAICLGHHLCQRPL
jgi:hypothetical protein